MTGIRIGSEESGLVSVTMVESGSSAEGIVFKSLEGKDLDERTVAAQR